MREKLHFDHIVDPKFQNVNKVERDKLPEYRIHCCFSARDLGLWSVRIKEIESVYQHGAPNKCKFEELLAEVQAIIYCTCTCNSYIKISICAEKLSFI